MLDVRIPEVGIERLEDFKSVLPELGDFTRVQEIKRGSLVVRLSMVNEPEAHSTGDESFGLRATSRDGHWVVQFRRDGLTFSRLPPYPDWHEFSQQAQPFVETFLTLAKPPYVERAALRYINHFRLPYPAKMADYFVGLPVIPKTLPQFVSNMLVRVTIHDPDRDFSAHITEGVLDDLDPEKMGFILDIDAFRTAELPSSASTLWETLDALRVFKNKVFFALITERNAEAHE